MFVTKTRALHCSRLFKADLPAGLAGPVRLGKPSSQGRKLGLPGGPTKLFRAFIKYRQYTTCSKQTGFSSFHVMMSRPASWPAGSVWLGKPSSQGRRAGLPGVPTKLLRASSRGSRPGTAGPSTASWLCSSCRRLCMPQVDVHMRPAVHEGNLHKLLRASSNGSCKGTAGSSTTSWLCMPQVGVHIALQYMKAH